MLKLAQTNMVYLCFFCIILSSFLVLIDCHALPRDCHDRFQNCETWKRSGFCSFRSHAFYLRNGCAKTCGFCKSNTLLNPNLHAVQDALRVVHKGSQKQHNGAVVTVPKVNPGNLVGVLHRHKLPTTPQLPQHHNTLNEPQQEKPECRDRFVPQTCQKWKDADICMDDRYRQYLTYGCSMTCRFCNCRDTYRENPYCNEWKTRGFCETYKEQLETYCPKTCGFCINAEYVETSTTPSQNVTTHSQNSTTNPNSTAASKASDAVQPTKKFSGTQPTQFAETGNINSKRDLPMVPERNSPLWSVNADTRISLPQPQQYDDMEGGAVKRPLEDGTYFTPAKTSDKFEYYTEHYSPDPYVAAAQREEWMSSNGVSPSPSLSRKSKKPEVKEEKEVIKVLKKSNIKDKKRVTHNNPKH